MANTDDFIVKNGIVVRASNLANYQSVSTTTGAIVTPGGAGIGGNVTVGGILNAINTATIQELQVNDVAKVLSSAINTATISPIGNALQVTGGIYAGALNIAGLAFVKGSQVLTQADGFKGGIITQPLVINTNTNSTSTQSGALSTPGGVGIGRDVYIGGLLSVTNVIYSQGFQVPTALTVNAGTGLAGGGTLTALNPSITLTNAGVITLTAGAGINIDTSTGYVTVTNIGVNSISAGADIAVSTSTGSVTVSNISTLQSTTARGNISDQIINLTNPTANSGVTWNTTSNALNMTGGIAAASINILNTSYLGGAQIVTTGTINQFIGGTILNPLQILNTTTSQNTITGALIVSGGVGIGQNLNVGGNLNIAGSLTVIGTYTTVLVNSTQTYLESPLLDIGTGYNNSALQVNDGLDRGLVLHYNTGSNATFDTHAFLGRVSSSGLFVYLTDVQPGGTTEILSNPVSGGNYGGAKFGSLQLVGGVNSGGNGSGDLQITGGAAIQGNLYGGQVFDNAHRVLTNQSVQVSGTQSGLTVVTTTTGTGVSVVLSNTGVLSAFPGKAILINGSSTTAQYGNITITNNGVTSLSVTAPFSANGDIAVSQTYGDISLTNLATLQTVTGRGNTSSYQILLQNPGQGITAGTTSNNALIVTGGIWAKSLVLDQIGFINGAQIITSATINAFSGGIINNPLYLSTTTVSTGTNTGALVVVGGAGFGSNINLAQTLTIFTTASTALYAAGGGTFMGNLNVGGNLYSTGTIYAPGITSNNTNLYLSTSTLGGGTIYANNVNLLAFNTATYFVALGGSDTNDGRRINSAFASVSKALSVATAGQTVYIDAGTYVEAFPLSIPVGVTITGAGLRATTITPTSGTKTNTAFLLNGETMVSDLTVAGVFQPGWGFEFAVGAKITTKSPYVERVTVLNKGSVTSATDPFGFTQADAGGGIKLDASRLLASSLEPACLFNEVTFIVPNATGMYLTNGIRAEFLNGFIYFANKAIDAEAGAVGFGGIGQTRLKFTGVTGTFTAGDVISYKSPSGATLASGQIASNDGTYIYINGPSWGWAVAQNGTPKTFLPFGSVQLSTAQFKFGTASALFNGSTDYLQVESDSTLQFGAGDFTVECWIYVNSITNNAVIFNKGNTASSLTEFGVRFSPSASTLQIAGPNSLIVSGATTLSTGQWYHVALVRQSSSNKLTLFLNGNVEASTSGDTYSVTSTDPLEIGADSINQRWYYSGYIDELRVSNIARYTSSFSLAGQAFNYDTNTVLLTHFDGTNGSTTFTSDVTLVQNISSTGSFPATATQTQLVDLHQFGAELRCIGSAAVYGNQGVIANGTGTDLKLIAFNVSNIGSGKDFSNDSTLVTQTNEMIQTNGGVIYYQIIDQSGNFRVGTRFLVNQATGAVSFGNASINLNNVSNLTVTDGTNSVVVTPTGLVANNLSLSGNTLASLSGNININPAGTLTNINSNLIVSGALQINSLNIPSTTDSTSTNTGALTVGGGVGIGADVNIGGTLSNVTTVTNQALSVPYGGIGAQTIFIASQGFINNAKIVTTATIGSVIGGNVPNALYITTTTNAVSTQTGALTVAGGVGIGRDVWVGGTIYENGNPVVNTINLSLTGLAGYVTYSLSTATLNLFNIGVTSVVGGTDISVSNNTGTVTINDSSTLQSVTNRGVTTTNVINVTNTSISTTTIANNAITVPSGGIGAKYLYLDTAGYIQGSQILTTASAVTSFPGQITTPLYVNNATDSINTQTGALTVLGGVGIGKNVNIGGSLYVQGDLLVDGSNTVINTTSIQTGDKTITLATGSGNAAVAGGAGIQVGFSSSTAIYAQFLFDGVGAWQSSNNIDPKTDSTYNLGESNNRWLQVNSQVVVFNTASSTSTAYSTSTTATNSLQTTGGIGAAYLYVARDAWVGGARVVTSANITNFTQAFNGGTINNPLVETDPTQSASTATGALTVVGGVGVGKNINVGGNASISGSLWTTGTIYAGAVYDSNLRVISQINLNAGTGINLSTSTLYGPGASLTVTNVGVTSITINPVGLSITGSTGSVFIANTGVTSILAGTDTAISTTTGAVTVWDISTLDSVAQRGSTTTATIVVNNAAFTTTQISGNALQVTGGIGASYLYLQTIGYINGAQIVTTSTLNSFSGGSINNALQITNSTSATSTTTGALQVTGGVGIGQDLWVGKSLHVLGDLYVDGINTIVNSNSITTGDKTITLSSASTVAGTATGSGIKIGASTTTLASFLFDGNSTWQSGANIVPASTLNYALGSPTYTWSNLYSNGAVISGATAATSTLTGALQVTGGAGIQGAVYTGGLLNVGSILASTSTALQNSLYVNGGAYINSTLAVGGAAWVNGAQVVTANNPFDVVFTSVTQSTNTQTGSLQLAGGLGVGGNINTSGIVNIANAAESTTTAASNALQVTGGIYADMLMVNTIGTVNGGIIITTATIGNFAFNGGNIAKPIVITTNTQATSTLTGAFQILNGGAGIGGNVYIGQYLNVGGTSTFQSTATFLTSATFKQAYIGTATINTGSVTSSIFNTGTIGSNALSVQGGIGTNYLYIKTAGWLNGSPIVTAATINSFSGGVINNQLTINTGTAATSTGTGALIVQNGGLGVGGAVWDGFGYFFVDPTNTIDGQFTYDQLLQNVKLGSNTTNKAVSFTINNVETGRFDTNYNLGLGRGIPTAGANWALDVYTPNQGPTGTANTMSNLFSFASSNWVNAFAQDTPITAMYSTSGDSGATFQTWLTNGSISGSQTNNDLVFAAGSYYNNSNVSSVKEWGRFSAASGAFNLLANLSSPTATHTSGNVSTSTIGGNALAVTGGIGASSLYITGKGWIAGSAIITAATIGGYQFNGGTITTPLYVNTGTVSSSPTSGALRVQGGVGIVGNLNVGGTTTLSGAFISANNTLTNINTQGQPLSIGGTTNVTTGTVASGVGVNQAALYVAGGTAIGQNLIVNTSATINGNFISTNTIAGNALAVQGGIGATQLYLTTAGYINGSQIVTSSTINSFSGGSISASVQYTNQTNATSTTTGAVTIAGGLGVGLDVWIGGTLYLQGDLLVDGTQTIVNKTSIQTGDKVIYLSSASTTAALAAQSGIAVGAANAIPYIQFLFDGLSSWNSYGNITPSTAGGFSLGSNTLPWNTEYVQYSRMSGGLASTTATNGTLVVTGGAGISGNLNIGSSATIASQVYSTGFATPTQNALYVAGGIGAGYLNITNSAFVNGSAVITAANIAGYQFSGGTISGILTSTNTTSAFSTTSGAIQVVGGIATNNNLWVGNAVQILASTASTISTTSNALQVVGGIGAQSIYLNSSGYINGSQIITAATLNNYSGGSINNQLILNSSTQATSTTTGALQIVNGGAGIGGNIYNGGIHVIGITANTPAILGTTGTGALQVLGGGSVSGNFNIGNNAYVANFMGIGTPSPGANLEVNGAIVAGAYNSSRVQIAGGALGSASVYEVNATESGYRWQIGKDLITIGVAGIGFNNQNQNFATGGAAVGAVNGLNSSLGFYTSNGSAMTLRGMFDISGNLVLGATTAAAKLDVRGSLRLQSGNTEHIILSNNASQYVALDITRLNTGAGSDLRIGINGAAGNLVPTAGQGDATVGFTTNIIYANQATYEVGRWTPTGLQINTATLATSITSGALTVQGGLGMQGDLWVGATANITGTTYINNAAFSTSTISGNALQVQGGIYAKSINLASASWINGYQIVTTNNIGSFTGAFNGGTITNPLYVNNSANATSTSTGAIYTLGGIASTKDLWVGGNATVIGTSNLAVVNASGVVTISNTTTSLTTTGGALIVSGSIGANYIYTLQDSYHNGVRVGAGANAITGNIALGSGALIGANSGASGYNIAIGSNAMTSAVSGSYNVAVGFQNLQNVGASNNNVAIGAQVLSGASVASNSVGIGFNALKVATGGNNTTVGYQAGVAIVAGTNNSLFGYNSGLTLGGGSNNTFLGYQSGQSVTSGGNNVILGGASGSTIATSNNNVLISDGAGNVVMSAVGTTLATTFPGTVNVASTTTATSTLTGALVIGGDMGVRDIYARNIYSNGTIVGAGAGGGTGGSSTSTPYIVVYTATNSYYGTGTTAILAGASYGGMQVYGGAGIWGNLFVGINSKIIVNRSFDSSGANLQVGGDMLSSGSNAGSNLYAAGQNNYLLYSSDWSVSNTNWSKFNASATSNAATSPDGTTNATKISESAATGNHYFVQTLATPIYGPVTYSVNMKAADKTFAALVITVNGSQHITGFNLSNGTSQNGATPLYNVTSKVENLNNGWLRCSMTVYAPTTVSTTVVGIYNAVGFPAVSGTTTDTNLSYTGASGQGVYIYGAQLEPGYYAGALIINTGVGVTTTSTNNIYAAGSLYIASTATVGGASVITTATLMTNLGLYGSAPNAITISNTTNSTSTNSGALIVAGGIGVGGNVYVGGTLYATAKSFLIDHPTKQGYKLQYGSLEGPENGVYVRGKLDGRVIDLPEYWLKLVDMDTITVDLTPIGRFQKLYVEKIDATQGKIYVDNDKMLGGNCQCFYTVWAERKDIDRLNVEYKG